MFGRTERRQEERMEALENERRQMRSEIAQLREEMKKLVNEGVDADDLDRKILAVDYECLHTELQAKQEHFADLGNIITQMRTERLKEREAEMLRHMEDCYDTIDYAGIARNQDYIAACREVAREEREAMDSLARERTGSTCSPLSDIEFMREIARAREARTAGAAALPENEEIVK